MSLRRASLLLATSLAVLAVALGLLVSRSDEPRADLVGAPVTTAAPSTTTTSTNVPTTSTPTVPPRPTPGEPRQLVIPDLSVEAAVVPVGLQADGSMEVPPADQVGWYLHGVAPGSDRGSAVLAAHVDYGGRRGVFFDLARLPVGAVVEVVDEGGERRRWSVTERYQVDKDALDIPELFRDSGVPTLTLITCGGAFDRGERSYEDNVVVRGVPV